VTRHLAGRPLDKALEEELNRAFPPAGDTFRARERACHDGSPQGSARQGGNRSSGACEPDDALARFSVDVVDITTLVGNHHNHPTGEIDLILPVDPHAKFDGRGAGWLVYGPGSGHRPTVTAGRAVVLYLLPEGRIEWTRTG
jgi:hypothetical protein